MKATLHQILSYLCDFMEFPFDINEYESNLPAQCVQIDTHSPSHVDITIHFETHGGSND